MEGVKFALHRQHTVDGVTSFDLNPMPGFENLTTDANGCIPMLDNSLPAGTYELREKSTLEGYQVLGTYIQFTVSPTGRITLEAEMDDVELKSDVLEDETLAYVMTIVNRQVKTLSFKKVDIANPENSALSGAEFELMSFEDPEAPTAMYELVSGEDGMLREKNSADQTTEFELPVGTYHLRETKAPAGYMMKDQDVVIHVTNSGVSYEEGTSLSTGNSGVKVDPKTGVVTLLISNSAGVALPNTGSIGTLPIYLIGGALLLGAVLLLILRRRRI